MQRITSQPEDSASMALQTLMILTTARRPLTANELCCALAIDLKELDDGFDEENIPHIDCVLSSCAGMVVCETRTRSTQPSGPDNVPGATPQSPQGPTDDSVVKLAHKSIRDYLSSTQSKWFPHAEPQMATICRTFLQELEQDNIQRETPFVNYALDHWGYHHVAKDQITPRKPTERPCDVGIARQESFPLALKQAGDRFGLQQLVTELEGEGPHGTGMAGFVLFWACRANNINVLEIFLSLNLELLKKPRQQARRIAKVDEDCGYSWCSAHGGNHDIFPGCSGPTSAVCTSTGKFRLINQIMVKAAAYDRQLMAEKLLSYGASFTERDPHGFTALGVAAWYGHHDMLSWILGQDSVDVEIMLDIQMR